MSFFSGGYYNIELAGSRLRLVSLNMNLYLEEVAEETKFLHHAHRGKDPASSSQNSVPVSSPSSDSSDPEEQWAWLVKVMEEAKKKGQNVSDFVKTKKSVKYLLYSMFFEYLYQSSY